MKAQKQRFVVPKFVDLAVVVCERGLKCVCNCGWGDCAVCRHLDRLACRRGRGRIIRKLAGTRVRAAWIGQKQVHTRAMELSIA